MTAKLIKGTEIREQILEEIAAEVEEIKAQHGVVPGLVTILVGENPASISYVTLKIKTAHRLGFTEVQDSQPDDISSRCRGSLSHQVATKLPECSSIISTNASN